MSFLSYHARRRWPAGRSGSVPARAVPLCVLLLLLLLPPGVAAAQVGAASAVPAMVPTAAPGGDTVAVAGPVAPGGIVAGTVVDGVSGAPLTAARVRLVSAGRTETTHDDGTFRFLNVPAGAQTLVVQRLGYAPVVRQVAIVAGDSSYLRVAMTASAAQLSTVVVTGTVGARLGQELLSPTSVLAGAELDRTLSSTIAGTIEGKPGVSVTSVGPATARPVIRGLGGDRILVLEDGMRPGDLSSTSGDHAVAIEPLTAQQVEVVRGPMSLLYGPSALGGVVNVVREEVPTSAPEHPHGMLSLEGSTVNGGLTGGGYGTVGVGRLALRGEASVRDAGDLRTPVGDLVNTGLRTYNLSGGAAITGDWGHAGASYRWFDSRYGIPGGFVGGHDHGVNIDMQRHMVRADAERHGELAGGLLSSVRATAAFTHYEHAEEEESGEVGTFYGQDLAVFDAVARHDALGGLTQGAAGVRAQWRDVVTRGVRTPNTRDWSLAGFLVEELGRGPLRVQGGVRYDWSRYEPQHEAFVNVGGTRVPTRARSFGAFSGSLGLLWQPIEWVSVGGSAARAYRTPDFNELYSDGPHLAANSYDVGDPRLKKETGVGLDAFVRLRRERLQVEVAAFRNTLDDFIYLRNTGKIGRQGGLPLFQYANTDARLTGAEGDVQWSVTPRVVVDGTVSYVRGRITGPLGTLPADEALGLPERPASANLPFMPPLNGRVGVRYETPRWFAGTSVRMSGRQERLGDFETETAGSGVLDASAGVRLPVGGRLHSLTLRLDNALDAEHRDHLSRIKAVMPQAGRNVSLLYRLMF